jgi:hypothetical protein
MRKPKAKRKKIAWEQQAAALAAKLPPEIISKLVIRQLASDNGEDITEGAVEMLKDIVRGAWLYKTIDEQCNVSISVEDGEECLMVEKVPLGEFLRVLWDDLQYREQDKTVGPKVSMILGKWMMVFAGKAEAPERAWGTPP